MRLSSSLWSACGAQRPCPRLISLQSYRSPLRLPVPAIRHQSTTSAPYLVNGRSYPRDSWSNTPPTILSKLDRNLHLQQSHPIGILKSIIESHFSTHTSISPPTPIVSVHQNFDELGFAPDHPGRSLTDSYYLNAKHMLRTHTSAHEVETYRSDLDRWLLSADVYRRDEIDASHYPVFHQMEGTHIWPADQLGSLVEENRKLAKSLEGCPLIIEDPTEIGPSNPYQASHNPEHAAQVTQHLKHSLNGLIFRLFGHATQDGSPLRVRWIEAFFPFTTPSYEVEVWWNGEWLELLGCGVVMQKTLEQAGEPQTLSFRMPTSLPASRIENSRLNAGVGHKQGWAFGLGLERIAMVLFQIPDIRLFWSTDPRFLDQWTPGTISSFKPYSRYPPCYKDMSFWLPASMVSEGSSAGGKAAGGAGKVFHENDYCEIVREVAGDLVENVTLIDEFAHPKTGRQSKAYRINYRSMDRSLSNEEVNALQDQVQKRVVQEMGVEIR